MDSEFYMAVNTMLHNVKKKHEPFDHLQVMICLDIISLIVISIQHAGEERSYHQPVGSSLKLYTSKTFLVYHTQSAKRQPRREWEREKNWKPIGQSSKRRKEDESEELGLRKFI